MAFYPVAPTQPITHMAYGVDSDTTYCGITGKNVETRFWSHQVTCKRCLAKLEKAKKK